MGTRRAVFCYAVAAWLRPEHGNPRNRAPTHPPAHPPLACEGAMAAASRSCWRFRGPSRRHPNTIHCFRVAPGEEASCDASAASVGPTHGFAVCCLGTGPATFDQPTIHHSRAALDMWPGSPWPQHWRPQPRRNLIEPRPPQQHRCHTSTPGALGTTATPMTGARTFCPLRSAPSCHTPFPCRAPMVVSMCLCVCVCACVCSAMLRRNAPWRSPCLL